MQPHSAQRTLPLAPQEPCEAQIHAEVVRLWRQRRYFTLAYPTLELALADSERARRLRLCARQALLCRQRLRLRQARP